MNNLHVKAALGLLRLPVTCGILTFLPAWTFDYWQAWLFIAVFFVCSLAITGYLAVYDPKLLERRMRAGPRAEKERAQKVIMLIAMISFAATLVVSALDHRFGWSRVPISVVLFGNLLIVLSYIGFFFVFRENTFGAATIQVAEDQKVISTGPYAVVRHPMYSAGLVFIAGIPLALGSWWGLLALIPAIAGIVWRLLDEERLLSGNLAGYPDYLDKVRYRLVPYVW